MVFFCLFCLSLFHLLFGFEDPSYVFNVPLYFFFFIPLVTIRTMHSRGYNHRSSLPILFSQKLTPSQPFEIVLSSIQFRIRHIKCEKIPLFAGYNCNFEVVKFYFKINTEARSFNLTTSYLQLAAIDLKNCVASQFHSDKKLFMNKVYAQIPFKVFYIHQSLPLSESCLQTYRNAACQKISGNFQQSNLVQEKKQVYAILHFC